MRKISGTLLFRRREKNNNVFLIAFVNIRSDDWVTMKNCLSIDSSKCAALRINRNKKCGI